MISIANIDTAALEKVLLGEIAKQVGLTESTVTDETFDKIDSVVRRLNEFIAASYRTTTALQELREEVLEIKASLGAGTDEEEGE